MSINTFFSRFVLKTAYYLRCVYSFLIYWFLYTFFLKSEYIDEFQVLPKFREDYSGGGDLDKFKQFMGSFEWKQEKAKGALDFTYLNYKFFVCEKFADKWGRDCDDFAHQWYTFFCKNAPANRKVMKVLLTTWSWKNVVTNSHFIVLVKEGNSIFVCDNNRIRTGITGSSPEFVMKQYAELRARRGKGYESTAWVVATSNK